MDSDSDSNNSDIDQDIRQLKACLDVDSETEGEPISLDEPVASTSNSNIPTTAESKSRRAKIEAAIVLNKQSDEHWKRLEAIIRTKLFECRQKLQDLNDNKVNEDVQNQKNRPFHYTVCGRPYFKDKDFCTPPHNNDTIIMQKAEMLDYANLRSVIGWTMRDKKEFMTILYKITHDKKHKEITSTISKLLNETSKSLDLKTREVVESLKDELLSLDKIPPEEFFSRYCKQFEDEYDWGDVARQLCNRHTAGECRALWKLFLHPSLNKSSWSKKEHIMLKAIAEKHKYVDWDKIAAELNTNRSGYQCFVYYRTNLNSTISNLKWSEEEDEYLKRLVTYYREGDYIPWGKVAAMMENRSKVQIYTRWRNSCQPKIKKGRFFPEEDAVLLAFVKKYGEDFRKASTYLPGRTPNQLRVRYLVLANTSVTSAVWTVEEDKKLIQLMANENSPHSYSEAAKYFPGKDRSHVRTRYMTLQKWMYTNPHADIAWAPRKRARCLHRARGTNLDVALTNLNKRLHCEVQQLCKKTRLSKHSDLNDIDDTIVAHLINDHIVEEQIKGKDTHEQREVKLANMVITQRQLNADNLKRLLVLLKSKMNETKFRYSAYEEKYPELLNNTVTDVKIRSYSKKSQMESHPESTTIDLWGKSLSSSCKYVLPPNYSTITGLKIIMAAMSMSKVTNKLNKNNSIYNLCKNKHFKEEWDLLLDRFQTLFTWPLLLSNVAPVSERVLFDDQDSDTSPIKGEGVCNKTGSNDYKKRKSKQQ